VPAVVAAQFSHTFFSAVLQLKSTIHEAFALANHVVQAHCTAITDNQYLAPSLPSLYSPIKATLPDNSSIPSPSIPGVNTAMGLALAVPGGLLVGNPGCRAGCAFGTPSPNKPYYSIDEVQ